MNNLSIPKQPHQQPSTSSTRDSSVKKRLSIDAAEFIPGNSQHNDRSVRAIYPTSSLNYTRKPITPPEHSQLNNFAVQVTQRERRHNPWLNPDGYVTSYECLQQSGAFFQDQQQNSRQTTAGYVTSCGDLQHDSTYVQSQQQNSRQTTAGYVTSYGDFQHDSTYVQPQQQNPNSWQNIAGYGNSYEGFQQGGAFFQPLQQNSWQTTAECEASNRHHQQFLQDTVIRNLQNPPPGFANKTPQKNSTTDKQVNTFIKKINNLHDSDNKDISKQVAACFNYFKKEANFLTDDHRKQLLRIIPTISEIIDKRNLDHISIITILYSLAKTGVFCKINPNNTSENECIRYEQESINLIDKILTKALQTHEKNSEWDWSNIFYALGLLTEQSPYLITKEQTNKLLNTFNFFIQKNSITELLPQNISNIFLGIVKFLKYNKLNSKLLSEYSIIEYLLQQIRCGIDKFNVQGIAINIYSISNLAKFTEFVQLIYKNNNIIESLMLRVINDKDLNWNDREISVAINGLGMLTNNLYFNKELYNLVKTAYVFLYNKMSFMVPEFNIETSNSITSGIIKLMLNNLISSYKPSKEFIRNIILNKVITNPSIINTKNLYQFIYTITFFQEYLTKRELIWIFKNINFFTPDVNNLKIYFTSMGYLLVKILKELNNDGTNKDLLELKLLIATKLKKTWEQIKPNIKNIDSKTIYAIHNTCSLVDEITNLPYLTPADEDFTKYRKQSELENICLNIIKTLMPKSSNFKQEYAIPNLPPVDACITYRDENSLAENFIAIEIQGAGHYLDDNGEYHNGKHLLKIGRLQKAGIKVIEINGCKISNFHNSKEIAAYLINLLLENHVEIRSEYKDNIPQLLQDAGIKS